MVEDAVHMLKQDTDAARRDNQDAVAQIERHL
eukprot:SAG31_NODE_5518_length_2482_cov_2.458666_1_plen_31_part_10